MNPCNAGVPRLRASSLVSATSAAQRRVQITLICTVADLPELDPCDCANQADIAPAATASELAETERTGSLAAQAVRGR